MEDLYHDDLVMLAEGGNEPKIDFNSAVFERAAEWIRERGEFNPSMLREMPALAVLRETLRVLQGGIGEAITEQVPAELIAALENNAFVFSGFKTYHSLNEVGASLTKDGKPKSFEEFHKDVEQIDARYNQNYLYAEYNHAIHSSQMAVKWHDFEQDGDRYDLQYRTANDEKVRAEHQRLNGITLPPSDPFWERYLPPNGWNCRCNVVQVRKDKYPRSDSDDAVSTGDEITAEPKQQMFRFNAGKELKIYPDKHPYYKAPKEVKETVLELAKEECDHDLRVREMIDEMPNNITDEEKRAIAENNLVLEKALNMTKGKPMAIDEADKQSANPKHKKEYVLDPNGIYRDKLGNKWSKNPDYKRTDIQYSINCATCAPAYALRLMGFDVKAKGRVKGSGSLNDSVAFNRSFEMWKNIDGTPAKPTLTNEWLASKGYKLMNENRYKEFFNESCKEEGVYVLTIGWRGGGGHATIIQKLANGELKYVEPQEFNGISAKRDIQELCAKGKSSPFAKHGIMRVDNKIFDKDFVSLFDK